MGNLLFNPQGRILKNRFWQGLVVLTTAGVILRGMQVHLAPVFGMSGSLLFGLIALVLVYVQICVYAKRFHDAGTTGWWIIVVWIGAVISSTILNLLFGGIFVGEEGRAIQQEVMERMQQGELEVAYEAAQFLAKRQLPLNIMSVIFNAIVIGFIVGSLATEPRTNKHGPVPGTEHDEFS